MSHPSGLRPRARLLLVLTCSICPRARLASAPVATRQMRETNQLCTLHMFDVYSYYFLCGRVCSCNPRTTGYIAKLPGTTRVSTQSMEPLQTVQFARAPQNPLQCFFSSRELQAFRISISCCCLNPPLRYLSFVPCIHSSVGSRLVS